MVGVCSHGVVAAAMPAMEVASKAAGAGKHGLRQARVAPSPLQSAFLGNAAQRHLKSCGLARRAAGGAVSVVAAASSSGDSGSAARRAPEETAEVFFYSGSVLGHSPAGGRRVKWEIGSVAGAEKEAAASSPSEDAPFASWSHLGFNGGKRNDLKKILVLGAGLLADPSSSSCVAFFLCLR
jgi:hypothetical protein